MSIADQRREWNGTGIPSSLTGELNHCGERARGGVHLEEYPVSLSALCTHSPQEARPVTYQTPRRTSASRASGELHHGCQFPGGGIDLEDTSEMPRPTAGSCPPPVAVAIADQRVVGGKRADARIR